MGMPHLCIVIVVHYLYPWSSSIITLSWPIVIHCHQHIKQLCSALGVDVIATGGSDEKLEIVKQQALGKGRSEHQHLYLRLYLLGGSESLIFCSHVSLSGSLPHTTTTVMRSWLQQWRELQRSNRKINRFWKASTNILISRGVQLVYDTVGGIELGRNSLKCLQFGGRLVKLQNFHGQVFSLASTGALYDAMCHTMYSTPSFFHSAQCSSVKIETHDHYYGINATINSPHDRAQHDATETIYATWCKWL